MDFAGVDYFEWLSAPSQLTIVRGGSFYSGQVRLDNTRVTGNDHCKWSSGLVIFGFRGNSHCNYPGGPSQLV